MNRLVETPFAVPGEVPTQGHHSSPGIWGISISRLSLPGDCSLPTERSLDLFRNLPTLFPLCQYLVLVLVDVL